MDKPVIVCDHGETDTTVIPVSYAGICNKGDRIRVGEELYEVVKIDSPTILTFKPLRWWTRLLYRVKSWLRVSKISARWKLRRPFSIRREG